MGQIASSNHSEPSIFDLNGRMYESKTLTLNRDRWHQFPFYYKPARPYRIIKDLTIMPGATLTIEKGVEIHVWPNVRILVLGKLIADGTFWEPIRLKPINVTEYQEVRGAIATRFGRSIRHSKCLIRSDRLCRRRHEKRQTQWLGRDSVYWQFPSLRRENPFFQAFTVRLNGTSKQSGFLEFYNATTGEYVPSCDREFTLRNAQVVCRELGCAFTNVQHWLTPRWSYNPKLHILKSYTTPRQCSGVESRLDLCPLRINGNVSLWRCMNTEHFNYINCGDSGILNSAYIGNWGGITFAHGFVDYKHNSSIGESMLRNVEVVGGGFAHNETIDVGAIVAIRRAPLFDHLNITNSSMDALQILSSEGNIILNKLNITQNLGSGIKIWISNLYGTGAGSGTVKGQMSLIPYNARGLLDICASQKFVQLEERIILYYKYDSIPVDCVKIFYANGRNIAFRLLLVNLYDGSRVDVGRSDALSLYTDSQFTQLIHRFAPPDANYNFPENSQTAYSVLALHLRASAADGKYGFIVEVIRTPTRSQPKATDEVLLRQSRIEGNDRGALVYQNTGEIGPKLLLFDCSFSNNGYHIFGNFSSSKHAIQLNLHNTLLVEFRNNMLLHNIGGLSINGLMSNSVARLAISVRDCAFVHNANATILSFIGNGNQRLFAINNLIANNWALYEDTVRVSGMSANFTRNLFGNNTGVHCLDLRAASSSSNRISANNVGGGGGSGLYALFSNWFRNNVALGHGHQYMERYGYQTANVPDNFLRRPKRQVIAQKGVSFDWWTHVGEESERYRSTIFVNAANQIYRYNSFDNPLNLYELATGPASEHETRAIDARENYWGYPGTTGVASGKIRDQSDYSYLIRADYVPVLESNTSLIEGDCPAGWFELGVDEFCSCFIYVGAAATYTHAVSFCQELDAFVPYMRVDDQRQKMIAKRIDDILRLNTMNGDRFGTFSDIYEKQVWISGVSVPVTHCGWLSTRTGGIGTQNCNNLLPFVCERGVMPYDEPALWRGGIMIAIIALIILLALIVLLVLCWYRKSRKRSEEELTRKEFIRASLRLSKLEKERRNNLLWANNDTNLATNGTANEQQPQAEDAITKAHRSMIYGDSLWSSDMYSHTTNADSNSNSSLVTSFTDRSAHLIKPSVAKTCSLRTNSDSESCATTTETFTHSFQSITPLNGARNAVSSHPDLYAAVSLSLFNKFGSKPKVADTTASVNGSGGLRYDDPATWSMYSGSVTGTGTATCSTCARSDSADTETATLTDRSSSSFNDDSNSLHSDRTIQARPLLGNQRSSSQSGLPGDRNPLPATVSGYHPVEQTQLLPEFSAPPRRTLYETMAPPPTTIFDAPKAKSSARYAPSSSSSYRSSRLLRPSAPPPNPPLHRAGSAGGGGFGAVRGTQNSQSLVDLLAAPSMNQQLQPYKRRNSTGRTLPIETSM